MKRFISLSAVILLSGLCGCGSQGDKLPAARHRVAYDDASFAAGTGRPPSSATSYTFARILIGQGRDRDALYILSRIARDHPGFIPAYNEMGGIYVRSDRLDDALEVLSAGLKHAPSDSVLHNNLGMCHLLKGDHAQALEAFTQAANEMPSNPTYRANRAAALAMLGRDAEAAQTYQGVLGRRATQINLAILGKARHVPHEEPDLISSSARSSGPAADHSLAAAAPAPPTTAPAAEQ